MNKLIQVIAILSAPIMLIASPAATQQWVRNYVSTNTPPSGVSQKWVLDYIRTGIVMTVSSEISYAEKADSVLTLSIYEAEKSGLHALAFVHNSTNGEHTVKMADSPSGNGWTNVVYECGVSTNVNYEAALRLCSTNYVCSSFSNYTGRNVFTYSNGAVTNDIIVWYTSITTNGWKTARGDN